MASTTATLLNDICCVKWHFLFSEHILFHFLKGEFIFTLDKLVLILRGNPVYIHAKYIMELVLTNDHYNTSIFNQLYIYIKKKMLNIIAMTARCVWR